MIDETNNINTSEEISTENVVEETTADVEKTVHELATTAEEAVMSISNDEEDDFDWEEEESGYSASERARLTALYDSTLKRFEANEIVTGTVVSIGDKEVILNIGFKSEGIVAASEFRDTPGLKPGDEVEVFIESVEDQDGQLILSRKRAKSLRSWENINAALEDDRILVGEIRRRTKGGFVVDISGIEAFLPGSQIDVKPVRDFDAFVGRTMEFKVVKINHAYENVVVSHKVLIEEKLEEQRKEILKNLEKGQVLEGTVKNMTNFGVFIDLGGVDGLLHITDISWGRINHPEELLKLDQKVNVVVLDFDDEKKRISLGMKQLTPHPWDSVTETLQEGSVVEGKVVTVAEYGIFLEIVPGVEGLIHTSEMSWSNHIKNPSEMYRVGDKLQAVVLNIDRDDRKMSLGLKQLKSDPWSYVTTKYPVNSVHKGLVKNMTNYGLFVELEEGVDGLVHISDLSWTKKFNHPSEYVRLEQQLEVVVLEIDLENRRLRLGHKQLTEDVWETFATIFTVGTKHKGTIKHLDSRGGATVEVEYGLEGTVPPKHMRTAPGERKPSVDDTIDLIVIEFHKEAKKLVFSHSKTWKVDEKKRKKKQTTKINNGPNVSTTLGEFDELAKLKAQMEEKEKAEKLEQIRKYEARMRKAVSQDDKKEE